MNLHLEGKLAVVSGASQGIGFAIARALLDEGCGVAAIARDRGGLERAAHELDDARLTTHELDVTDESSCRRVVEHIVAQRGAVDVLIANVGSGASLPPGEETAEEWQRMFAINLLSATNLVSATRGTLSGREGAAIVCVSSICGRQVLGAPLAYSASKAALDSYVRGVARPLASDGIRINAVSPGNVYFTGGTWHRKRAHDAAAVDAMLAREVPLGRFGTPQEIAAVAVFLASSQASFMTGSVCVADGGQSRS